jgi:hypothetical protein
MFSLLETKFRIDNLLLLDLEIFIQVIELVVECDKGSPLFIELVLCSFVVVLFISYYRTPWVICVPAVSSSFLPERRAQP